MYTIFKKQKYKTKNTLLTPGTLPCWRSEPQQPVWTSADIRVRIGSWTQIFSLFACKWWELQHTGNQWHDVDLWDCAYDLFLLLAFFLGGTFLEQYVHHRVYHMLLLFDVQTLRYIFFRCLCIPPLKLRVVNMFLASVFTLPTINTEGYPPPICDCLSMTNQRTSQHIV